MFTLTYVSAGVVRCQTFETDTEARTAASNAVERGVTLFASVSGPGGQYSLAQTHSRNGLTLSL